MSVASQYVVRDLSAALAERRFPTITVYNRLEGRPRKADFSRALKAEVRDALWMLTKQWQVGEFKADDAGSPIFAKARMRTSPIARYRAGGAAPEDFTEAVPLEAKVEQRVLRWTWNGQKQHLDLRAQAGRQWRKLLDAAGLAIRYEAKYRALYPIALPPRDAAGDYVYAHRRGWQQYAALAGRAIDGGDLLVALVGTPTTPPVPASTGIALDVPSDGGALDGLGTELVTWFARQYLQPGAEAAWQPPYLEYQFACTARQAGRDVALAAEEYAQGHLDWYSFDRETPDDAPALPDADTVTVTPFIPTPIAFEGMPDARWWSLEDRKTDFGAVKPSTTELAQLLLMEFGLVYSNDWFLIPFRIPVGTLARVEGLAVTNNFGERFWISPAGAGLEDNWHRWSMFDLTAPGARLADTTLVIPPATARTLDGDPLEEVELARDEVANMVWAIERTIPSVTGVGRSGKDEGRETRDYHEQRIAATNPTPPAYAAPIYYRAMTSVPEHWIPFLPVHVPDSVREVQLQRARMPRIIPGDPNPLPKVPPRTTLIREGLDVSPSLPYFLHEEEIPRAGILVTQSFRRTRWHGGQATVWLGIRKQTGRGERGSGLAFDTIETPRRS
jgi:hypothetical protein